MTFIKQQDSDAEIRRKTDELLGDADDGTIKTFVDLLENFKNADAEDAYHRVGVAQRAAYEKTVSFENAFRAFAGIPLIPPAEAGKEENSSSKFQVDESVH